MIRPIAIAATLALATSACSASEDASAPCDPDALREAVLQTNPSGVVDVTVDAGFDCDAGWAWAAMSGVIDDGDTTPTQTYIFRANGDAWTVEPRVLGAVDACGTLTDDEQLLDVPPYPSDAQVPESLWLSACWSG